jgi:hypothetical protein
LQTFHQTSCEHAIFTSLQRSSFQTLVLS